MSKTDWEILRGLADWIVSLGLEEGKHHYISKGKFVPYGYEENHVVVYVVDDYVSLETVENGEKVQDINIHSTSASESFCLSSETPTKEALIKSVEEYAQELDVRKLNISYRNKLRWLKADSEKRRAARKSEQIKMLNEKIKRIKEQD